MSMLTEPTTTWLNFFLKPAFPEPHSFLSFSYGSVVKHIRFGFGSKQKSTIIELLIRRAATLIISLLLVHSLVDYPLRTTAHSAIFAFFCGILRNEITPDGNLYQAKHKSFWVSEIHSPEFARFARGKVGLGHDLAKKLAQVVGSVFKQYP